MRQESQSTVTRVSADVLWDYLADYDRVVRLGWPEASARRLEPSRTCAVRYKVVSVWEGVRSTYVACLESPERPRTLIWTTKNAGARSSLRFDLQPLDAASTHVTITLSVRYGAALRALEPFAWGLLRPAFLRTLGAIEALPRTLSGGTR